MVIAKSNRAQSQRITGGMKLCPLSHGLFIG